MSPQAGFGQDTIQPRSQNGRLVIVGRTLRLRSLP